MKKIIKKIGNQLISFLATFSLIINLSQPLLIVYAEELSTEEGAVEEVSNEDETTGEESASEEEPAAEEEPVEEEEATVEEEPAVEEQEDELASDNPEDAAIEVIEEDTPEEVIEEPAVEEPMMEEPAGEEPAVEGDDVTEEDATSSETVCNENPQEAVVTVESDWAVDGKKAETVEAVKLGVKYVFPQEANASIEFTCLPKEGTDKLTIKQLELDTLDLPEGVNPIGDYAYDLTTNMVNGTFEYKLVLPKPEDVDAGVSYIEKTEEEVIEGNITIEEIKLVEAAKLEQEIGGSEIQVNEMNHFTIVFVSVTEDADLGNIELASPGNTNSGDFLIAGIVFNGGSNMSIGAPSGWSLIRRTNNGTDVGLATYYKFAQASEPDSYTWSVSNGASSSTERIVGGIIRYEGVDQISPIDVYSERTARTGNDAVASAVITHYNNTQVIAFYGVADDLYFSTPSGTNERYEIDDSGTLGGPVGTAAFDYTHAVAGSTGAKTSNMEGTSNEIWVAQQVALVPAAASALPSWPTSWTTPSCNTDPNDESPSQLDIIGNAGNPAVFHAKDSNFLYLREKVDGDPRGSGGSGMYTQHNWVVVDDQDGDGYYDYLLSLNGKDEKVQIWQKTGSSTPIDWTPIFNDPADTLVWEGNTSVYSRIDSAGGSDWFVTWAIPLTQGAFTLSASPTLYFASSADGNNANKDHLSCYEPVPGTITIVKDTQPDSSRDFGFSGTGGIGSFTLDDDGPRGSSTPNNRIFSGLDSGLSYTITESADSAFGVQNIICTGGEATSVDLATRSATVNLAPNENVTCTFTNVEYGKIHGIKFNDKNANGSEDHHEGKLNGWRIFIDQNGDSVYQPGEPTSVTDGWWIVPLGYYSIEKMLPGHYSVCEVQQAGWVSSEDDHAVCKTVALDAGESEWVTFGNYQGTKITFSKITCTDERDLPNWGTGGPDVTATTAQNWVKTHRTCSFTPNWLFQYGPEGSNNPGDSYTGLAGGSWITTPPTGPSGSVTVELDTLPGDGRIEVREVLMPANLPFTYQSSGGNSNNVSAEMYCSNDVVNYDNWDFINNPQNGGDYHCVAFNVQLSSIGGYKFEDLNGNGSFDSCWNIDDVGVSAGLTSLTQLEEEKDDDAPVCETMLGGWTIFIDEDGDKELDSGERSATTESMVGADSFGQYNFNRLLPGEYSVCEVLKPGWVQTFPAGSGSGVQCHTVRVPFGDAQNTDIIFGNTFVNPKLEVSKSNDASGDLQSGDIVTYTLTIEALDGDVENVILTDLLPDDFDYNSGSWTSSSTVRGLAFMGSEPSYASPGVWDLGDMEEDEVVTLTYTARIQDSADSGLYKDLAWAKGENILGGKVLAIAVDPGFVNPNFAGTEVNINNYVEPDAAEIDVEENKLVVGEVLGASTFLPATGSDTNWIYAAFIALIIGIVNILMGVLLMKKKITLPKFSLGMKVFGLVIFGLFIFSPKAHAGFAPDPMVRIEEPSATAIKPFGITFVAQDLLDRPVTAQCYMQRPSEGGFSAFGSVFNLGNGGDSDVCAVTNSELTEEGSYKFKVAVTADDTPDQTVESEEVTVAYDGEGPERPRHIEVNKVSSCKYEIEVKTHSDGNTAKIEVYADDDLNIEVNDGSKIKDNNMGPDEEYDFDYEVYGTDCDKDWFFATRAFDSFGNPSDVRVQEVDDIETITTETTDEGTEVTEGAIPTEGGSILGEQTGEEGSVVGEVLGEGTESEDATMGEEVTDDLGGGLLKSKVFWAVLILLALVLLNVLRKKIKNQKK